MNVSKRLEATIKVIEAGKMEGINRGKLGEIRDLANYKYHVDSDPIMSDWAFDRLERLLGAALGSSLPESYSAGTRELARLI